MEATKVLDKYRQRMFKATSKEDLMMMLGNAVKIIKYEEMKKYNTIQELLEPYQAVIMLYPNANHPEMGHWCCIFVMPGTSILQYFDSYGIWVDKKVSDFNEKDKKVKMHEMTRMDATLTKLILESPYGDSTYWNDYPFQADDIASCTCGLWCVIRLKCNHLNEEDFKEKFLDAPLGRNVLPDLLVSTMICDMYPEKC